MGGARMSRGTRPDIVRADGVTVGDLMVEFPKTLGQGSTVGAVRELFRDTHVHMVLLVGPGGRLITAIERADIPQSAPNTALAAHFGTLKDRVVAPSVPLTAATQALQELGRRRFAVIDGRGTLLGLLCLNRKGGYCSDEGIRARERERRGASWKQS